MNKQAPDILSDQAQSHLNRTILKLAWPAILEQFLICMASLADTAMVGSIGASATAAVAVNISSISCFQCGCSLSLLSFLVHSSPSFH